MDIDFLPGGLDVFYVVGGIANCAKYSKRYLPWSIELLRASFWESWTV